MSKFIIEAAGIKAVAERKHVKYIRISIKPPDGRVEISVPVRTSLTAVRNFIKQKKDWITEKQSQFRRKMQAVPDGKDSVLLWGRVIPLVVITGSSSDRAELKEGKIIVELRDGSGPEQRVLLVDELLREQISERLPQIADRWENKIGVKADEWRTRRMKTRWGSCNTARKRIWLNVRLAMLPQECLEYVVAHELCHLHEPSHNERFKALMDVFYPDWRKIRKQMGDMSAILSNVSE